MSGAFLPLARIDDREIQERLRKIEQRADRLQPCLKNIGIHLVQSTQERFTKEIEPSGKRWAALRASTLKRKKHTKILTETSGLRDSFIWSVRGNALRVGTNKVYGAPHQFGLDKDLTVPAHKRRVTQAFGKPLPFPVWVSVRAHSFNPRLPARPILGFSAEDRTEIAAITGDYLVK